MMAAPISKVGFLHFGVDHNRPLQALESALQDAAIRCSSLRDSMIVLPEGFNLGQHYWDKAYGPKTTPATSTAIIGDLKALSSKYGCALVAGLIVDDCPNVSPPFNSAYLIDGEDDRLLARKHQDDGSTNYSPFPEYYSKSIVWRGIGIITVICMDCYGSTERFGVLADEIKDCSARVVCIPMHMSNGLGGGPTGYKLTGRYALSDAIWVAANPRGTDVNSFVAGYDGIIREPVCGGNQTRIEIFPLADLI
jgi:predicted amidohydrolase